MKLISSVLFLSLFMACTTPNKSINRIGLDELTRMSSEANTTIIDVRTPGEVAEGYVTGTTEFIDFNDANFEQSIDALDKSKNYIVYCRSGNRSTKALNIMDAKGFENLYELEGGVLAVPTEKLIKP